MSSNMCAMCGGSTGSVNYAKQVDPPRRPYGTILGDRMEETSPKNGAPKSPKTCMQMCLPVVAGNQNMGHGGQQPTSIIHAPCDPIKPCPKIVCEPCPPRPPTKIWLIKSSPIPQKVLFSLQKAKNQKKLQSACLPVGDSSAQNCCSEHLVVYLPCPAPTELNNPAQQTNGEPCVKHIPFGVPQPAQGQIIQKRDSRKYLPPPERKICPPHCIHVSDIKRERSCTVREGIPCVAHCYETFQNRC